MPQHIINPANAASAVDQISVNLLPKAARKFGYVPDFGKCLPGDLILFRDTVLSRTSKLISEAQGRAGFADEHSAWTHAAIFLYEDFVVEAVPWPGVHTRSLYVDIPTRILRVRRKPGLPDTGRYKIALRALRMLGARYGLMAAVQMGLRMAGGLWNADGSLGSQSSIICSKVFFDAYAEITRTLLATVRLQIPFCPRILVQLPISKMSRLAGAG